MSRVKNENYIVEYGWMVNELCLKGNELRIYAIIYGFSQAENQAYTGSLQYLADWINGTRVTALRCLQSLVEKDLIDKTETFVNGVKFCEYRCKKTNWCYQNDNRCSQNDNGGRYQNDNGCSQNDNGGVIETIPNTLSHNAIDIPIIDIQGKKKEGKTPQKRDKPNPNYVPPPTKKKFVPPSLEEVKAYCSERGNKVNAERFVDYYTSTNWYRGKTKIKDWRACVRTWEKEDKPAKDQRGTVRPAADHEQGGHASGFGW